MTYEESEALMRDATFKGRVKVAALSFATYVVGESPSVEGHNSRYKWAQTCYLQPDIVAGQLQSPVVLDPAVQADGAEITDSDLQTAVEKVIKAVF